MIRRVVLLTIIIVVAIVLSFLILTSRKTINDWAYQLQGADPKEIARAGFDLVVIDYSRDGTEDGRYSKRDIMEIKSAGVIPVAYISIGEAEDYRYYWNRSWYNNPPEWLGRENPEWPGCYAVKYWYPEWKSIILGYVQKIVNQGFQGLYLDKVDEFEYWSDPNNGEDFVLPENETAKMMIDFIVEIADYARSLAGENFWIIPQNGESLIKYDSDGKLLSVISGWAVEDLFFNGTSKIPESITNQRIYYLDKILASGKLVLVVDYVDDGSGYSGENLNRIETFIDLAEKHGYIPYAAQSDRALDELNIIPDLQPKS